MAPLNGANSRHQSVSPRPKLASIIEAYSPHNLTAHDPKATGTCEKRGYRAALSHGCLWAQPGTATVRCPAVRRSTWCIQHLPSRRARNGTPQRTCGNLFTSPPDEIYWRTVADVAELADAPDSKSGTRESVWVRPPPSAPAFAREGCRAIA